MLILALGLPLAFGVGHTLNAQAEPSREVSWDALTRPATPELEPVPLLPIAHYDEHREADVWWLAATVWGEARNQSPRAMRAVADVAFNRIGPWGRSMREVVTAPGQFSCWNRGDPNHRLLTHAHLDALDPEGADGRAWVMAQRIAVQVVDGDRDTVHGATLYHERHIHPWWLHGKHMVLAIGDHRFYTAR